MYFRKNPNPVTWIIPMIFLAIVALFIFGCAERELAATEVALLDKVVALKRGDLVEFHSGSVVAIQHDVYSQGEDQLSKEWTEIKYREAMGMGGECPKLLARVFVQKVKQIIPYGHQDYGRYAHQFFMR